MVGYLRETEHPLKRTAIAELQQKSLQQIQVETAYNWAYRASAARALGLDDDDDDDAIEYEHEALEHAALSGDDNVLYTVRRIVRE